MKTPQCSRTFHMPSCTVLLPEPSCTILLPESPFFHNGLTLMDMSLTHTSVRQAVCPLEQRLTETRTGGTNSMTSTADVGGNKIRLKEMILTHSYYCHGAISTIAIASS